MLIPRTPIRILGDSVQFDSFTCVYLYELKFRANYGILKNEMIMTVINPRKLTEFLKHIIIIMKFL